MSFYAALRQAEEISTLSKATATKIRPFVTFIQMLRSKLPYISVEQLMDEIIERYRLCGRTGCGRYR